MDYHVFVLSRVREGIQRGLPPKLAVEAGVTETAGVVTSAAAVMVSVFAVFATLSMIEMKQMGVGLAVAVLIDATLIRVIMLPVAAGGDGPLRLVAGPAASPDDASRSRSQSRRSASWWDRPILGEVPESSTTGRGPGASRPGPPSSHDDSHRSLAD